MDPHRDQLQRLHFLRASLVPTLCALRGIRGIAQGGED